MRVGSLVFVAGTTASGPEGPVGGADAGEQAREVLRRIAVALEAAGATLADVTRTRIFLTSMDHVDAVGAAHGEVFREIRPASTAVQVAALVDPALLVEIEADAVVGEGR